MSTLENGQAMVAEVGPGSVETPEPAAEWGLEGELALALGIVAGSQAPGLEALSARVQRSLRLLAPPEELAVSEWAARYRIVETGESSTPGPWSNERAPYQVEIMDAFSDPKVEKIVIQKCAQSGGTQTMFNMAGYVIDHAPAPILWVQTTALFAQSFSKVRFSRFLAENPRVDRKIDKNISKIDEKIFPGGILAFVGSKAAGPLRSRPIKYLFMDDIDGFVPTTGEGDPLPIARERLKTYKEAGVSKEVLCSSPAPSTKNPLGYSRIAREYKGSDQRRWLVPCRHCGHDQLLEWERVAWDEKTEDPETAFYVCVGSGCIWSETDRRWSIQKGKWIALNPPEEGRKGRIVAGFQFSELDTPFSTLAILVRTWLSARGKENEEEVFYTANLGRTVEYTAEKLDPDRLYDRRESYTRGIIPKRAAVLSVGVDVQGDRLEVSLVAWGRGMECWLVDHLVIPGKPEEKATWEALEKEVIFAEWDHAAGGTIMAGAICVDSGAYTSLIYQWKRNLHGDGGRVRLIKGIDSWDAMLPNIVRRDVHHSGKKLPLGIQPWNIGSSFGKMELMRRLSKKGPDDLENDWVPNYVHFPEMGRDYFKQLCAEELRIEKDLRGHEKRQWYQTGPNEALDCWIMARAGAEMLNLSRAKDGWWKARERARVGEKEEPRRERKQALGGTVPAHVGGEKAEMPLGGLGLGPPKRKRGKRMRVKRGHTVGGFA